MSSNKGDQEELEVEAIRDIRGEGDDEEYFIKWMHYPESANNWEKKKNVRNVEDIVDEFKKKKEEEAAAEMGCSSTAAAPMRAPVTRRKPRACTQREPTTQGTHIARVSKKTSIRKAKVDSRHKNPASIRRRTPMRTTSVSIPQQTSMSSKHRNTSSRRTVPGAPQTPIIPLAPRSTSPQQVTVASSPDPTPVSPQTPAPLTGQDPVLAGAKKSSNDPKVVSVVSQAASRDGKLFYNVRVSKIYDRFLLADSTYLRAFYPTLLIEYFEGRVRSSRYYLDPPIRPANDQNNSSLF